MPHPRILATSCELIAAENPLLFPVTGKGNVDDGFGGKKQQSRGRSGVGNGSPRSDILFDVGPSWQCPLKLPTYHYGHRMYGIMLTQVYKYYQRFKQDAIMVKFVVRCMHCINSGPSRLKNRCLLFCENRLQVVFSQQFSELFDVVQVVEHCVYVFRWSCGMVSLLQTLWPEL